MPADMHERVECQQNRIGEDPQRVLQYRKRLPLMIQSLRGQGAKQGSVEGRHESSGKSLGG